MSAAAGLRPRAGAAGTAAAPRRLALLGTGTVGTAFVARYRVLQQRGLGLPKIAWLANSRAVVAADADLGELLARARAAAPSTAALQGWAEAEALREGDLVVDATASDLVANWHPEWLARGVNVVTANKLGHGSLLARSQAIVDAQCDTGAQYGDSATVGAGLPLLRSLRALVAGGDRIHAVEGVLSGSLGWLFDRYDGSLPFSHLVRDAAAAGYTEPDPRIDLSGEDVKRKLLILARAAGLPLEMRGCASSRWCRRRWRRCSRLRWTRAYHCWTRLAARLHEAREQDGQLRFVGRFGAAGAGVGLCVLPSGHPLCGGGGTDNRVLIRSDRYAAQPLLIQAWRGCGNHRGRAAG